jgi:hypothetical protein
MKIQVAVLNQNASLNKILRMAFPKDEFELLIFTDFDKLNEALKNIRPAAFLISLSYPGDGPPIGCRLLSREEKGNAPILAIEEAFRGKDAGPSDQSLYSGLFRFPFDAGTLVDEVRRLVEAARPFLPLPEDPLGEESASIQIPDGSDLDGRIGRLAERLWERRQERLKTEIMAEVREELRHAFGPDSEPEDA